LLTSAGVKIYDLTLPAMPRLASSHLSKGWLGIRVWRDGFLTWGEGGLQFLSSRSARAEDLLPECPSVLDAIPYGSGFCVGTPERVIIYTHELRRTLTLDVEGGVRLLAVSGNVMAVASSRIQLFDLARPETPLPVDVPAAPAAPVKLWPYRLADSRCAFFVQTQRGGAVFAPGRDNEVDQPILFRVDPWFTSAAQIGRLHVQYDRNRNVIAIYSRARAVTVRR
jgi:hypothetical protein